MTDELPDNIVLLDVLRVNRNAEKHCKCERPHYTIDTENHIIECDDCGAHVDPFAVLVRLAKRNSRYNQELERLYEQRKQLMVYKPHLIVIRELERQYRGRKLLPCCPHCKQAFYLEDIRSWVNAKFAFRKE